MPINNSKNTRDALATSQTVRETFDSLKNVKPIQIRIAKSEDLINDDIDRFIKDHAEEADEVVGSEKKA